jgi:hypothetical protein
MQILQSNDGFLWGNVTHKAKEIFNSGLFELFIVNYDDSDYLIEDFNTLNKLLENGDSIYIEIGHSHDIKQLN